MSILPNRFKVFVLKMVLGEVEETHPKALCCKGDAWGYRTQVIPSDLHLAISYLPITVQEDLRTDLSLRHTIQELTALGYNVSNLIYWAKNQPQY